MSKPAEMIVAIVAMASLTVGVYAADDLQKQVDPQVQKAIEETIKQLKSHPVHANEAQTTHAIKLLAEPGKLGPY